MEVFLQDTGFGTLDPTAPFLSTRFRTSMFETLPTINEYYLKFVYSTLQAINHGAMRVSVRSLVLQRELCATVTILL